MSGPDPLQIEVARIALAVAEKYGFALGGGLALVAHGIVDRPTEDVDVFTDRDTAVPAAAELVDAALHDAGFDVTRVQEQSELPALFDGLEQHIAEWELHRDGHIVRLSLSCQARLHPPVRMDLGPVMDLTDLLAWKVAALVGRARERDYVDVAAVLDQYSPTELLAMARQIDPGLEDEDIPRVGRRLNRLPDEAFLPYQLTAEDIAQLRQRFTAWPR